MRWHFPLVVGPLRDGTDKQGAACHVCDAAVHPGTLRPVAAGQRLKVCVPGERRAWRGLHQGCRLAYTRMDPHAHYSWPFFHAQAHRVA